MFKSKVGLFKLVLILSYIIIFVAVALGLFWLFFEIKYVDKIYPNIYIGGLKMEGKTLLESKNLIDQKLDNVNQEGIIFYYENNQAIIYPIISSPDAALTDVLINFKVDETVNEAMLIGRSGDFKTDTINKLKLFFNKNYYINLIVSFDNERIINDLREVFSVLDPENATYYFDQENNLSIKQGRVGKIMDYEESMTVLKNNLGRLDFSNITLRGVDANPEISESDCLTMKDGVISVLDLVPIKLKYNKKEWVIDKASFIKMLILSKRDGNLLIDIDRDEIKKYIEEEVAIEIDQDPVLPKFNLSEGKVENFESGREGRKLNVELAVNSLSGLLNNPFKELDLSVEELSPGFDEAGNNKDLGIREIIGKYTLGFEGSTNTRISNIKNGAKSLNGLLLKAGEEFSMLEALGSIDEAHGYVKEAVIKGNAISYEFGGGLCHSSTTLFRAVLDAGLPITMRRNHSYNMPYYEPAGVDATIYDPYPDFKFINDTGNYILMQAEANNKELAIELWGTKDGRIINRTEPFIYNVVKPNPTRMVKTSTLATGKVKCTYIPYNGADAYFDYEVIYPDGTVKKERFSSHYVPRQGVCLVGI